MQRMKETLPPLIANQAQRFFTKTFKDGGFDDNGLKAWKEVNRRIPGTPEYKYPKTTQLSRRTSPILVRTGKLRRAVSESIRTVTFDRITLTVALPYAGYVNDGTENMPQRKFMGDSADLRKQQIELIEAEIDKTFKV